MLTHFDVAFGTASAAFSSAGIASLKEAGYNLFLADKLQRWRYSLDDFIRGWQRLA